MALVCSFAVLAIILMKFIVSANVWHLMHYNTERTFQNMNEFFSLANTFLFFNFVFSSGLYALGSHHQTVINHKFGQNAETEEYSMSVHQTVALLKMYLIGQFCLMAYLIASAKHFSITEKESANVKRVVDKQALKVL